MQGAMERVAAERGIPFSRYGGDLLEAAWTARVRPDGSDLELEAAVSTDSPSTDEIIGMASRAAEAERKLRHSVDEIERLSRAIGRKEEEVSARILDIGRWRIAFLRARRLIDKLSSRCEIVDLPPPPPA